jgi:hypothetical protein
MAFIPLRCFQHPVTCDISTNSTVDSAPDPSIVVISSLILTLYLKVREDKRLIIDDHILAEFNLYAVLLFQNVLK